MKVKKIAEIKSDGCIDGHINDNAAFILIAIPLAQEGQEITELYFHHTLPNGTALTFNLKVSSEFLKEAMQAPSSIIPNRTFVKLDKMAGYLGKETGYTGLVLFKNQIFQIDLDFLYEAAEEEAILLVKKHTYLQNEKLKRLKQEVDALEGIVEQRAGAKRTAIPEAVKLFVFQRDQGKCVYCGSSENLHFDHIIPVSKGGGNSVENIQILCEACNLRKSDKIAI